MTKLVLGIESSCDETACAVVSEDKKILASVVWSQYDEHRRFGGVVPEIAARAHLEKCDLLIRECMEKAGVRFSDLSAVAVAGGPGLIGG
ncbi:MAG: tRNA (adenosine(37)-N6)-threonylcarbamoyltransferase complex transferase subunit TsaD, partial [Alphaproteobacteria bacterium]|nr:tRNA (adenosine(37)-N6)-threonylcarbamoyltransferase complex transferase subunit TsaD [Alphaproteobacteria bacterium]